MTQSPNGAGPDGDEPMPAPFEEPLAPIPIIPLWDRLVVSLQGDIRDEQLRDLERRLLGHIREKGAEGVAIDASGLWMLDSHLCSALGRIAAATQMMGVRPVVCGLSPDIAMTLEAMGFELEGVETSLGLETALARLGVRVMLEDGGDE
jgi:rsbT antagonist protein RsbS